MNKKIISSGVGLTVFLLTVFVSRAFTLSDGYILVGAYGGSITVLLDTAWNAVYTWDHSKLTNRMNGYSCYLLPSGNLLRTAQANVFRKPPNAAPAQGAIDEVDSLGNLQMPRA